jgi:hypothetical protein
MSKGGRERLTSVTPIHVEQRTILDVDEQVARELGRFAARGTDNLALFTVAPSEPSGDREPGQTNHDPLFSPLELEVWRGQIGSTDELLGP